MYQTKITSQGTISLPIALRKKYNLTPGEVVTVEDNGRITLYKTPDLSELRAHNKSYVRNRTSESGDGFSAHVKEKYGT